VLFTERTFLREGEITFDFNVLSAENEESLRFYIDDVLNKEWKHTSMQGSITYTAHLRCLTICYSSDWRLC
jgi:hypothetical protein